MNPNFKSYLQSMRTWQWTKNLVVFTLPIGSGLINIDTLFEVIYSFIGISLISSSIYIFNDIKDISVDSMHPLKKHRPIASGVIKIPNALIMGLCLLTLGLFILYKNEFIAFLLGLSYVTTALMYTLKLKYISYIDSVTISILFILRLLIGGYSANISPSIYLIMFIFFSSFGLAVSKRISILQNDRIENSSEYLQFLKKYYDLDKLKLIFKAALISSFTVYLVWSTTIADINNIIFIDVYLLFSILGLSIVLYEIYKLTLHIGLEDFVLSIIQNKKSVLGLSFTFLCIFIRLYS